MDERPLVKSFLENRDSILGFIYSLTRDYQAAEDVFQEVAMTVMRESDKQTSVRHFLGWLHEIARHRIADYYRRSSRLADREQSLGSMEEVIGQAFEENCAGSARKQ